jgi:hypothetical protein
MNNIIFALKGSSLELALTALRDQGLPQVEVSDALHLTLKAASQLRDGANKQGINLIQPSCATVTFSFLDYAVIITCEADNGGVRFNAKVKESFVTKREAKNATT